MIHTTDHPAKTCPCDCYWAGRTRNECLELYCGHDPCRHNEDDEQCEQYPWKEVSDDEYTDEDIERYIEIHGYRAAFDKFGCRVCDEDTPRCSHCEWNPNY